MERTFPFFENKNFLVLILNNVSNESRVWYVISIIAMNNIGYLFLY